MKHNVTVKTIEALEARTHFGSVLEEVEKSNTRFLVSKRGKPTMIMLSLNDYLQNILKEDSLLTRIHMKAKDAGLDKTAEEEVEAEIKAVRMSKAEKKPKTK